MVINLSTISLKVMNLVTDDNSGHLLCGAFFFKIIIPWTFSFCCRHQNIKILNLLMN